MKSTITTPSGLLLLVDETAIESATQILAGVTFDELDNLREADSPTHESWMEASCRLDQAEGAVRSTMDEAAKLAVYAEGSWISATTAIVDEIYSDLNDCTIWGRYPERAAICSAAETLIIALAYACEAAEAQTEISDDEEDEAPENHFEWKGADWDGEFGDLESQFTLEERPW